MPRDTLENRFGGAKKEWLMTLCVVIATTDAPQERERVRGKDKDVSYCKDSGYVNLQIFQVILRSCIKFSRDLLDIQFSEAAVTLSEHRGTSSPSNIQMAVR